MTLGFEQFLGRIFLYLIISNAQTALSDAILTRSLFLRPPPQLLVTVSDSYIVTDILG
jgi:hypothetical protein